MRQKAKCFWGIAAASIDFAFCKNGFVL